jgi:hypothetical protein
VSTSDVLILDGAKLDAALHGEPSDPRAYLARFGYEVPPLDQVDDTARPIDVEVNHGLWIWRCPCTHAALNDQLSGGGMAFLDCPLGWCPTCENAETVGRWRRLRFPPERTEIERVLALRPDPETRNWWPGETLAELAAENAEHGIGGQR